MLNFKTYLFKIRGKIKENTTKTILKIKIKIAASTWNDEFELSDGFYFVSDIQDHVEYFINNMKHQQ